MIVLANQFVQLVAQLAPGRCLPASQESGGTLPGMIEDNLEMGQTQAARRDIGGADGGVVDMTEEDLRGALF